jgi:hypothetical protein
VHNSDLQPERWMFRYHKKDGGKQGADDIHAKWQAGIARRKVAGDHHLPDLSDGVAEQNDGGSTDGGGLEGQVTPMARSAMPTNQVVAWIISRTSGYTSAAHRLPENTP